MKMNAFRNELKAELFRILRYWTDYTPDQEHSGFYGKIDHEDRAVPGAEKGLVMNSRIMWAFSAAYGYRPDPAYKVMADRAYHYLADHFTDPLYDGAFWSVYASGEPLQTQKQFYGQGFLLYGLTEYYRSFREPAALSRALALYRLIEQYGRDHQHGGYFEVADRQWNIITDHIITRGEPKSMNTHLHIMEPYTLLLTVQENEELRSAVRDLLTIFLTKIVDPEGFTQRLFFENDWTPLSDTVSFGHDIEASWLLCEAAEVLNDPEWIARTQEAAVKMAYNVKAYLDVDGGLFNEGVPGRLNREKHWWVQAEAMVGFMNAFHLTGDKTFLESTVRVWEFIKEKLRMPSGEWCWGIDEAGRPMIAEDKAGMWKCPYHNVRALIEVLRRTKE